MGDLYKELGFKQPKVLRNPCGIRIYIGTKGKDDWCIVIPKALVKLKNSSYSYDKDYAVYLISEQEAISIAKEYTELAMKTKGV
jgi:hypothetical protein